MATTPVCATCHPPAPGRERLNDRHVAVRFGDHGVVITLNGTDVTNRCREALAPDWVILYDEPKTVCSGDHVRTTQHHGHVEIERTS